MLMMNERTQFIWAACTIFTWLLTFLFLTGYASTASNLSFRFLSRDAPTGQGLAEWNAAFAPDAPPPTNLSALLAAASCGSPRDAPVIDLNALSPTDYTTYIQTSRPWAPLCNCLAGVYNTSRACAAQTGSLANNARTTSQMHILRCYMTTRPVQHLRVRTGADPIRPYIVLLMVNTWAALAACVLLVRDKLADKGSYAVQLMLQLLLLALTLGGMWLALSASTSEWVSMLVVSFVSIGLGWIGDNDPAAWYIYQFLIVYASVLPAITAIYNAYTHRLEVMYFASSVGMSATIALGAAISLTLQRISRRDINNAFWHPVRWANLTLSIITILLVTLTYDEGVTPPGLLKSSWYAWFTLVIYISLAMHPKQAIGGTLCLELAVRAILTVAMINELFP